MWRQEQNQQKDQSSKTSNDEPDMRSDLDIQH